MDSLKNTLQDLSEKFKKKFFVYYKATLKYIFKKTKKRKSQRGFRGFGALYTELKEKISETSGHGNLSVKEQTFFVKRLSFLITAGIPLIDSLHMIREQTISKRQGFMIDQIITDLSNGQSLSRALGKFDGMFSDFALNIISVGESTGILSQNLEYLAEELKKKQILQRKVIGAFIYPAVVTVATFGITIFLMIYLFPKIIPVFSSLHVALPLSTRIVIASSNILIHYGLYIFILMALCITGFIVLLRKNKDARFYFDMYILKIPFLGSMLQHYNLASSTRTLGLLLKSGITLSEALPITAKTTENLVYKKEFNSMEKIVSRGEKISLYLKSNTHVFPSVVSQISSVGERSGNLANSFLYLSDLYEKEVDDFTKNISSLIEPIMMIIMGVLVGFIAISIITPIYSITQNLHT